MELPLLKSGDALSSASLIRSILRAKVTLGRAVVEETSLEVGTAFARSDRPGVADANFIAEAHLPKSLEPERTAKDLVNEALSWFSDRGATCREWLTSESTWPEDLSDAIQSAGYAARTFVIHRLDKANLPADLNPSIQVIPGRAGYSELKAYYKAQAGEHDRADEALATMIAETRIDQLDEPGYDVFLGRIDDQPLGAVGVITLGSVGVVHDLYALGAARGQGLGKALMTHAIQYCARAQLGTVIVCAPLGCPATPLYAKMGFTSGAQLVAYRLKTGSSGPTHHR